VGLEQERMGAGAGALGPAARLKGTKLPNDWIVGERIGASRSRSVGYRVKGPGGQQAFLKAFDFFRAYEAQDTLAAIDKIDSSIRHELRIVKMCAQSRMSRVVRGLAQGEIKAQQDHTVWYQIFEWAEGDVRHELAKIAPNEQVWRLRTLHQTAVGLTQMHRRRIYHLNVKPSHLLEIPGSGIKLGDLSTASRRGTPAPLFDADNPGDPIYAPPEALYGFRPENPVEHQQARDMYLFGSLIAFLYLELTTTTALLMHLPGRWHPCKTGASFGEALPYLDEAFDLVAEELVDSEAPEALVEIFRELCRPDPRRRGHPRAHAETHGSSYSLERYVSKLALELWRAEGQVDYGGRRAA
jgi:serine/threonine protein kinase